jgi:tetratricopeptide (TPR) repeat protein
MTGSANTRGITVVARRMIVVLLMLLQGMSCYPSGIDTLFTRANDDYSKGLYDSAIERYTRIVESGYESAGVYFNLGNAYFKSNDIPSAILFYEKALKLSPNDEDTKFNLKVANTKIMDKIQPVPELFYKAWWRSLYNLFSTDRWARITIIFFIFFFVLLSFFLLSKVLQVRKIAFWTAMVFLGLFLVTLVLSSQRYREVARNREAIVFSPTVTIKSSPSETSVDLFVIHEGLKVKIIDQVGEWYEIRIANGSVGWLPVTAVKSI